jgi:hypothetical protein
MKTKKSVKELKSGILLTLAAGFMLFLYAPLEIYFSNKSEFWFDIYILFPVLLVLFLIFVIASTAAFGVLYLLHRRLYQVGLVAYFIGFVCTYIQGNFLVLGLPPLAGSPIFWDQYPAERIKCIVMWIAVIVIVAVLAALIRMKKFYILVNYVSIFMMLVLLVTIVTVCISNNGLQDKRPLCVTDKYELQMSEDTNYIILMMDSLDSRMFGQVLNENPEYQELLSDFTYYPNMVGAYGYTQESVPFILSGVWYENDRSFDEYNVEAYKSSALFDELENRSYRMGMYDSEMPLLDDCLLKFENIFESTDTFESLKQFAIYQIKLMGYKYAPFDMKEDCVFDQSQFWRLKMAPEGSSIYEWDDRDFYHAVNENDITYTADKCFKLIHLEGAHVPFHLNEDLSEASDDEGTYENMVKACFTTLQTYINKLKENNVYDNTVLIIMSDHGYQEDDDPWGRWNPAFMAKGLNENHELYVSNAPVSYVDLQEAFLRLMDGKDSTEIFDWKEGDYRERRYIYYEYNKEEDMYEGIQIGSADDLDSLTLTGKEYHLDK